MFIGLLASHPAVDFYRESEFGHDIWWTGLDGLLRFEISDHTSGIRIPRENLLELGSQNQLCDLVLFIHLDMPPESGEVPTLGDVLNHRELFTSYPSLAHIPVFFFSDDKEPAGALHYAPSDVSDATQFKISINVSKMPNEDIALLSMLLHEIQHAIQCIEGFLRGGALNQELEQVAKELGEEVNDRHYDVAVMRYKMLPGEIEAREVERRLLMSQSDRMHQRPYENLPASVRAFHQERFALSA